MAVINTNRGGTDASDGEVLSASGINDTFNTTLVMVDKSAARATGGIATNNSTYTEIDEVTFSPSSSNNIIMGVKVEFTSDVPMYVKVFFKDQDGTYQIVALKAAGGINYSYNSGNFESFSFVPSYVANADFVTTENTELGVVNVSAEASSYDFKIEALNVSDATGSASDVIWTVYYLENYNLTTSSGKFA